QRRRSYDYGSQIIGRNEYYRISLPLFRAKYYKLDLKLGYENDHSTFCVDHNFTLSCSFMVSVFRGQTSKTYGLRLTVVGNYSGSWGFDFQSRLCLKRLLAFGQSPFYCAQRIGCE